jgi:AraC-like DNA-binding protein
MLGYWPFLSTRNDSWCCGKLSANVEQVQLSEHAVFCRARFPERFDVNCTEESRMAAFSVILMITSGYAYVCSETDESSDRYLRAGEWVLISDRNELVNIEFIQGSEVAWFELDRELWHEIEQHSIIPRCHRPCISCVRRSNPLIVKGILNGRSRLLLERIGSIDSCDFSKTLQYSALISELLAIVIETPEFLMEDSSMPCYRKTDRHTLEQIGCYLEQNLHCDHSLRGLSKTFNINETKLKRGFRDIHQNTVFGFLREKRMQHALEKLTTTDDSVLEIAYSVGYSNPSQFTKAFRVFHGKNPSDYRRVHSRLMTR